MYFLFFVFNLIKPFLLLFGTVAVSIINMQLFKVRGVSLSSLGGDYVSMMVIGGVILRCYIAGIASSTYDYSREDGEKAVYTAIANILIIIGFTIGVNNIIQYIISIPIVLVNIRNANAVANGNMLFNGLVYSWSPFRCWSREWKVILFVTILGVCLEYLTISHGGALPVRVLK